MITLQTFKLFTNPYQNLQTKKTANNNFLYRNSNLAPLQKDTFTFRGQVLEKPATEEISEIKQEADFRKLARSLESVVRNEEQCQYVYENAKVAERHLKKTLEKHLHGFVFNKETNPHGQIMPIETRIKSPESTKEKVMDALANVIIYDKEKFKVYDSEDIKKVIGDIVGARIVLRKSQTNETKAIIDKLIGAVESGELKITKIQNYVPSGVDNRLRYFDEKDIKRLIDVVNDKRQQQGQEDISYKCKTKDSGYMALHLDVDLSNPNYQDKNNNYTGEIQILGYDIEKLKDVEDYAYKIKQGKALKAGNKAYSLFEEYFMKYYEDEENYPRLDKDFQEYTSRAYLIQRKREPLHAKSDFRKLRRTYKLPTINECGMNGKIPPQLDFNVLRQIKVKSDELYNVVKNAERINRNN